MICLAIYIIISGYAKAILREIMISMDYYLSSPEYFPMSNSFYPYVFSHMVAA